jgi:hypothetical protein
MKNLAVIFRIRIKKSRIKKCHQRRIRKWIERRHRTKRTTINRSLRKQLMFSLQMILIEKALKNTFSNYSMKWSTELQKNNSLFRRSSSKRNFFRCCMLTKSWFDEYISFKSWNLIRIRKWWFIMIIFRSYVFLFRKFSKLRRKFDTSTSHNADWDS